MTTAGKYALRCILMFSGLFFAATNLFGQYGTFNQDERNIRQHPVYEEYIDIILAYNDGKPTPTVISALDSLADVSLQNSRYVQFLFLTNESANILSHQSKYIRAYKMLESGTKTYSERHDTLHMEYFASLRLMRNCIQKIENMPDASYQPSRSPEALFDAQFALLDTLGNTGEAYRNTLVDYGLMLFRKGETSEAIENMYKTRYMALDAGDLASLALADYSIITNMPVSWDLVQTQNKVLKADITLFEAKKSSIPVKLYNAFFHNLVSSNYYEHFNDTDSAITYAQKSLNILDSLKFAAHNIKAATHGNLAIYYGDKTDTSSMWHHVEQARHLAATKAMSPYNRAFAYCLISEAVLPYSTDSAFTYLSVLDSLPGKQYFAGDITSLKAKAHIQEGNAAQARDLILHVFDDVDSIGDCSVPHIREDMDYTRQIDMLSMLETVYTHMSKDSADCTPAILSLIQRQNTLFQKIMTESIYGYEVTSLSRLYDEFLERVLPFVFKLDNTRYHAEKTRLLISSKAIQLNSLMAKKKAHFMLENDSSLFSQLIEASQKIQTCRNELSALNPSEKDKVHSLQTKLNSHLIEYLMLRYRADKKMENRNLNMFQDNFSLASTDSIQQELTSGQAIIEYFMLDRAWGQMAILPDTVISVYHENSNLNQSIQKERYALMTGRETTDIGDELMGGLMPCLQNTSELIIIPDGALNFIPFESMKTDGSMLVKRFAISYSYSSALWYNLQQEAGTSQAKSLLTIAPGFNEHYIQDSTAYSSTYWGQRNIGPLPYSREEVSGIANIMQHRMDTLRQLNGIQASKANVKDHISHYDIVHFASHGIVNEQYPERSGMILYKSDSSQNTKNVHLEIFSLGELFNMNLDAGLLVLSSCYSGKGSIMEGEGIIALPRGAILAGVPRTLASLWNVHDERTKDFMLLFYKHLANGNPYRNALQKAKLDAIEAGFLTKNWAGFVLIGI